MATTIQQGFTHCKKFHQAFSYLKSIVITNYLWNELTFWNLNQTFNFSLVAHGCGALAGLLVGIAVLKNRKVEEWEIQLRKVCLFAIVIANCCAISWNFIANDFVASALKRDKPYFDAEVGGFNQCKNVSSNTWIKCSSIISLLVNYHSQSKRLK